MGFSSRTITRLPFLLPALLVIADVAVVRAQTATVTNPTTLVFTPSADHAALLGDGRAAVDHYDFDVYSAGASQPFQSTSIGKPAPSADGLIYYDFSASVVSWPLPGGSYEARVAAVGPEGSGLSAPSNAFTFGTSCSYALSGTSASLPATGGGTQVGVTTDSGCTWSAASNVSWILLGSAGGTGSGTVVATVAANGSTTPRTGTLAVAGSAFTVNQAAASAAPSPGLPSPWLHADVGSVGLAGSAAYANGEFTVAASGAGLGGASDGFGLVYRSFSASSEVVARVAAQQAAGATANAGITIRDGRSGLSAGAAHAALVVGEDGTVRFLVRSAAGGTTRVVATMARTAPVWLRLSRSSSRVTAAVSADGSTWQALGTVKLSTREPIAGLVATGGDNVVVDTATFDGVSVR